MNISPKMKKILGISALALGGFFVVRQAFGSGGSLFGGGVSSADELPKGPTAANFQGAITETTFGDITNPGMNYAYNGGAVAVGGDTNYLDYNTSIVGGDSGVYIDYGSPTYGDVLYNMVAPPSSSYSPCCGGG